MIDAPGLGMVGDRRISGHRAADHWPREQEPLAETTGAPSGGSRSLQAPERVPTIKVALATGLSLMLPRCGSHPKKLVGISSLPSRRNAPAFPGHSHRTTFGCPGPGAISTPSGLCPFGDRGGKHHASQNSGWTLLPVYDRPHSRPGGFRPCFSSYTKIYLTI
jgi:hypothetical protein